MSWAHYSLWIINCSIFDHCLWGFMQSINLDLTATCVCAEFCTVILLMAILFPGPCLHSIAHFLHWWYSYCSCFNAFSYFSVPIMLPLICRSFNSSISSMPNNVSPSPGTTKKMHFCVHCYFQLLYCTSPNCVIVLLLHGLSMVVSFVATSWSAVVLGNNFFKYIEWIILPLQPHVNLVWHHNCGLFRWCF